MSAKYQLPCACGRSVAIEPKQAGESVVCECGTVLLAPTMLKMATLEVASEEPALAPSKIGPWGGGQRMELLGGVLLVAATTLAILAVLLLRPVSRYEAVGPERIHESFQHLSPWQSWRAWESMRIGIDPRPDKRYVRQSRNYFSGLGVAAVLAIAGVGLVVEGMRVAKGKRGWIG